MPLKTALGLKLIQLNGPKANDLNQLVEWTDGEVNKPTSRLYGWNTTEVKEYIRAYAAGTAGANTIVLWAGSHDTQVPSRVFQHYHPHPRQS